MSAATGAERPLLLAIVGPTAVGKSTLGIALAGQAGGEVISCDSTAVYRGFDIGTDKVPAGERRGIAHHVIDVVDPEESYSAARYARDAAAAVRAVTARGRIPIVVGGTGLYYRALVRGMFQGPGRDERLRSRLRRIARRRGVAWLHQMVARIDPASARRILVGDERRLVRALEVYFLTHRPISAHFVDTRSPVADYDVVAFGVRLDRETLARRIRVRVDRQFAEGLLDEVQSLLARGVPPTAHPFGGLVYRQALEHLAGQRDEVTTRTVIIRENLRYARRQLIWFRKEPNLHWIDIPGEHPDALGVVERVLTEHRAGERRPAM